jgi:hypothetical protein
MTAVQTPKLTKKEIRQELYKKSIPELKDTIAYHEAKAAANQRIVAIAKLCLKSLEKADEVDNSSTDNARVEQPNSGSNSGGDK